MSKLAAVVGQPTQGIGAAPAPAPPAKSTRAAVHPPTPGPSSRQYASPLEAQRAEAEAAGAFPDLDPAAAADPLAAFPPPPPTGHAPAAPLNPRSAHSAAAATVTAAWLSLSATELEVRRYFKMLEVQSGLEMLARMRKQCDLAAETLQQRMDEGNRERCSGCNKTLEEARKAQWIMQGADVDPDTGVPMPYRYCGPMCVRERNREKMLPPDQRDKKRFDGQEMGDVL